MKDDDDNSYEYTMPDHVPDWLVKEIRKSKGGLEGFENLDKVYAETDVLRLDRFDKRHFKDIRGKNEELDNLAGRHSWEDETPRANSWGDLIQDDFMGFYKASPTQRGFDEMRATHKINHAVITKAMDQREWKELRTYTELDEWASAMAAVQFGDKLEELFDEEEELGQAQSDIEEQQQAIMGLLAEIKQQSENGEPTDDLIQQLQESLEKYGEAAKEIDKQIKQNGAKIRQAVRNAAKETREDIEGVDEAMQMFGTEPGFIHKMPNDARLALAARIAKNAKLKELALKVGRFVRLALGEQARKIVHAPDEIFETELGSDLARVLPSQTLYLADEDVEDLFFAKFMESTLMQYELRGTDRVAQGAIVVMLDSSGSMMGVPEIWSKAVAIALLHIAAKQKRDFHVMLFSSASDQMPEWRFEKGIATPMEVLDFAETMIGGGTDFVKPIRRGIDILEQMYNDEGSSKGDLVLVTDGECWVDDEFVDRYFNSKEQLAFRMYGCLIGVNPDILRLLCDHLYMISEFATGDDVREVFGFV